MTPRECEAGPVPGLGLFGDPCPARCAERSVVLLNCGHGPAPMFVRRGAAVDCPSSPACAPALGLGAHGGEPARPHQVDFAPGGQLRLCTDGVTGPATRDIKGPPRAASNPVAGISGPPG
ncbi:SpoIIE family protein phosphatase [Streptomyces sp. NPDC057889]|uniref:SpoIIE family protein phosphatase n=1 Tax=unclassified Streptomyces TaxID=2593676 RepID=UPI0036BEAD0C